MTPQLWYLALAGGLLLASLLLGLVVLVVVLGLALGKRTGQNRLLRRQLVLAEDEIRRMRADVIAVYADLARKTQVVDQGLSDLLGESS